MKQLWDWCKKEAVLSIAIILAVFSAFFVHPDKVKLHILLRRLIIQ